MLEPVSLVCDSHTAIKKTVPRTVSSICVYTAISISGKQTGGSHHGVSITVMEAQYLASPQLPIKNPAREAALSGNEQLV